MADRRKNQLENNGNGHVDEQLRLFVAEEASFDRHVDEIRRLDESGALRLSRAERKHGAEIIERLAAIRWFSMAAVHLYELRMPRGLPQDLQRRLRILQRSCLRGSFPPSVDGGPMKADVRRVLEEAKDLLRQVDRWRRAACVREDGARQDVAG